MSYDKSRIASIGFTNCVVAASYDSRHLLGVIDTDELLLRLTERKIRNADIARALGLPDSRIPEIRTKRRALKLDEAVKLVRAFQLDEAPEATPLPPSVIRLLIRYLADALGSDPTEDQIAELTEDVRAFSSLVSDQKIRQSPDAAEGFFRALRLRRPTPSEEVPPGSDPHHAH